MRQLRISSIPAALVLAAALVSPALTSIAHGAEVSEFGTPNPEYLDQKAELEKLISYRDMDLYELSFEPMDLEQLVREHGDDRFVALQHARVDLHRDHSCSSVAQVILERAVVRALEAAVPRELSGAGHSETRRGCAGRNVSRWARETSPPCHAKLRPWPRRVIRLRRQLAVADDAASGRYLA